MQASVANPESNMIDNMIHTLKGMSAKNQEIFMSRIHEAVGRKFFYKLTVHNETTKESFSFEDTDMFTEYMDNFASCIVMILKQHDIQDNMICDVFDVDDNAMPTRVKSQYADSQEHLESIFYKFLWPLGYRFDKGTYFLMY